MQERREKASTLIESQRRHSQRLKRWQVSGHPMPKYGPAKKGGSRAHCCTELVATWPCAYSSPWPLHELRPWKWQNAAASRMQKNYSVEAVITEVNPGLWRNVWLMVYGNEEGDKQACPAESPYQNVKRVRCLFILSCMMHTTVPSCTLPFHLALSDFVEAHSKWTELIRVLYQGLVLQQDIDKNEPGKRMYCGDQARPVGASMVHPFRVSPQSP